MLYLRRLVESHSKILTETNDGESYWSGTGSLLGNRLNMTDSHFAGNAQLIRSARLQYGLDARGGSTCTLCLEPSERPAYIKHLQTPEVVDHAQDFAIFKDSATTVPDVLDLDFPQ